MKIKFNKAKCSMRIKKKISCVKQGWETWLAKRLLIKANDKRLG